MNKVIALEAIQKIIQDGEAHKEYLYNMARKSNSDVHFWFTEGLAKGCGYILDQLKELTGETHIPRNDPERESHVQGQVDQGKEIPSTDR